MFADPPAPKTDAISPRRLLITGGAGFIGSNFTRYWCEKQPQDRAVVLDALTYAGNRANLTELEGRENFRFVCGNIGDRALVDSLLEEERIDTVVHFAAESHVDRSIASPDAFIQTNVVGTYTLLEAFRQQLPSLPSTARFLHVSTDEVYGSLTPEAPAFNENTPYAPNSPYSASKAGSDHLARAYYHTYQLPTTIANCSNNYGPYHFPEKLIPLMCANILMGKPLPVYGDGKNVRDWLYVVDHCRALEAILQRGKPGETYAIGGNNQIENIELVEKLCELMDELAPELPVRPARKLITFVEDRLGHDRRYAIDSRKLQQELGWTPAVTFSEGLRYTVQWYLQHRDWWEPLLQRD